MRLGLLGGTFDPVHYGHLLLGESCRQQLQLDRIHWIPAGQPPHKTGRQISPGAPRADMLELALSGYPEFLVDRRELRRDGPSFTVDTLAEFVAEFPDAELFLLIGADSLRDIPTWRSPDKIAEMATIVAVNRPGTALPAPDQIHQWVGHELAQRVVTVQMPGTDISATELRERVRDGRGLRFLTPRAVEVFIQQNELYVDQA